MRWHFFRLESGMWQWEQEADGQTIQCAEQSFADKAQCIADARRHGFGESPGAAAHAQLEARL